MATLNDLITQKQALYDLDAFMVVVRRMQSDAFKESIDFYINELGKTEGLSVAQRGALAATAVNQFERKLSMAIEKNAKYQSQIRGYLRNFDTIDKINTKIHKQTNKININKIIRQANKQQRTLIGKTAEGIVSEISDANLTDNLTGRSMRKQFTKPVKRILYQNIMTGTPGTQVKKQLHDFIIGEKGKIGQLQRWTGQITRDALSQYDGAINDMVRKEYDLNAFRYIGSLVDDSRPQCIRWIRKKGGILSYKELTKEIQWAKNNGTGMIPGTNKDNFGTYRGGWNCRHDAIPFRLEEKQTN